jgi:hypothetical protein
MRNASHTCPASYCGNLLQHRRDATCRTCFVRLPGDYRDELTKHRRAQAWHLYSAASDRAIAWLNAHPPGADRRTGEAPT